MAESEEGGPGQMNKAILCGKCRTHNPEENKFCSQCGASLESVGIREEEPAKTRSGYNQMIQIVGLLGAVVIIAVMILIASVTTHHSTPRMSQNGSESTEAVAVPEPASESVIEPPADIQSDSIPFVPNPCIGQWIYRNNLGDIMLVIKSDGTGKLESIAFTWVDEGDRIKVSIDKYPRGPGSTVYRQEYFYASTTASGQTLIADRYDALWGYFGDTRQTVFERLK